MAWGARFWPHGWARLYPEFPILLPESVENLHPTPSVGKVSVTLFIPRSDKTNKNDRNAEVRYKADTGSLRSSRSRTAMDSAAAVERGG